jgi:hypothetical protein
MYAFRLVSELLRSLFAVEDPEAARNVWRACSLAGSMSIPPMCGILEALTSPSPLFPGAWAPYNTRLCMHRRSLLLGAVIAVSALLTDFAQPLLGRA